jgi:protein gp37
MGNPKYQADGDPRTSGPGFGVTAHPDALMIPLGWRQPRVVFVNSMSDLFHARVPLAFILQVFEVMAETPRHTYQVLTKRAHRLVRIAGNLEWPSNVWMGVSVESPDQYDRILSCEPLLGSLPGLPLTGIDWVIAGGESGFHARPVDPEWIRDLRDQCLAALRR